MNLLQCRAFATEFLKIATEVLDPDIRANNAEARGKEWGSQLRTNTEVETNFRPKLAGVPSYLKNMTKLRGGVTHIERWPKDPRLVKRLEQWQAGKQYPLAPKANRSNEEWVRQYRKSPEPGSQAYAWKQNHDKLKTAASFMAFTPVGTYNVRGKKPTAQSSGYETASNFAGTALKGGMTGAGAATLAHALRHGHELKVPRQHLGKAVGVGAGVALADRALRRHTMKKQLEKTAFVGSSTFTPARALQAGQETAKRDVAISRGAVRPAATTIGNDFRLQKGAR